MPWLVVVRRKFPQPGSLSQWSRLARPREAVTPEAAGPAVPIIGMSYYDPFLADVWFGTHDPAALQAEVDATVGSNDLFEGLYAVAGDPVADVQTAFSTTAVADDDGDGVPNDVEQACAWTWRCTPPPHGPDIHPNTDGYAAIADAFEQVLP